jgi:hypothetical protein
MRLQGLDLRALIADMDRFVIAGGPPERLPRLALLDQ